MSDQQESVKSLELILFEIIVQPTQENGQPQPGQAYVRPVIESGTYELNMIVPTNIGVMENSPTVRDIWLATPLFYKRLIESAAAVLLGTLIGLIIPWLSAGL